MSTSSLQNLRDKIIKFLPEDPTDQTDRAWLVAVYVSLRMAARLDFKSDEFVRLTQDVQETTLHQILVDDCFLPDDSSPERRKWLAGHFFNNALFRLAALAELRLAKLCSLLDPPLADKRYWKQAAWYAGRGGSLTSLNNIRRQINKYKHESDDPDRNRLVEDLEEAIAGCRELLLLLEQLRDAGGLRRV
jgi:hypothetical protein